MVIQHLISWTCSQIQRERVHKLRCGAAETNPTGINEDASLIPGLTQWVKGSSVAMSCAVGCRCGLDPVLLGLWCRPAGVAPTWPLAWELPYATGVAFKSKYIHTYIYIYRTKISNVFNLDLICIVLCKKLIWVQFFLWELLKIFFMYPDTLDNILVLSWKTMLDMETFFTVNF